MNVVILTPVRLLGQGLVAVLDGRGAARVQALAEDFAGLRAVITEATQIALIDVTHGYAADEVRTLAAEWPRLKLVALGLRGQEHEVVSCGQSGFCGYVPREATVDVLIERLQEAIEGRLACPAQVASALMRALYRPETPVTTLVEFTPRQSQVARLIERGLSNKEMARELDLSVGTVKHHVHGVLDRLGVNRRGQAMRIVRNAPWRF